jgi:predicted dehydrogenase
MSSGETLRWGVIGAGWFASRRHIPDIQEHPEARLAALCRRDPEALARLVERFEPEDTYTDWQEMLERCPLDVVVIATPHNLHYEPARAALERGIHVLVEKPLAVEPRQAWELCSLARERGLVLGVALNPPFWPHCHYIRAAIREGRIGTFELASLVWTGNVAHVFGEAPPPANLPGVVPPTMYRSDPERCGGGFLIDSGSHLVSEVLWTTGLRVRSVACLMDSTPSDRSDGLALTLDNGAIATLTVTGSSQFKSRRLLNAYHGSEGSLRVEGPEFRTTLDIGGEAEAFHAGDAPPVPGPVANMVDAVRGRAELLSPGEHGTHVVEVISAAYRSAAEKRTISI